MDAFLTQFQANIGSKVTIADLVHCKQKPNRRIIDFISRHQSEGDLQRMFIGNLQPTLRAKLSLNRYPNFPSLCSAFTNYQDTMAQFGDSSQMPMGEHLLLVGLEITRLWSVLWHFHNSQRGTTFQ